MLPWKMLSGSVLLASLGQKCDWEKHVLYIPLLRFAAGPLTCNPRTEERVVKRHSACSLSRTCAAGYLHPAWAPAPSPGRPPPGERRAPATTGLTRPPQAPAGGRGRRRSQRPQHKYTYAHAVVCHRRSQSIRLAQGALVWHVRQCGIGPAFGCAGVRVEREGPAGGCAGVSKAPIGCTCCRGGVRA